jgi:hypothetical protein
MNVCAAEIILICALSCFGRFLRKMEDILDSDYAYQNRFVPAFEPADSR